MKMTLRKVTAGICIVSMFVTYAPASPYVAYADYAGEFKFAQSTYACPYTDKVGYESYNEVDINVTTDTDVSELTDEGYVISYTSSNDSLIEPGMQPGSFTTKSGSGSASITATLSKEGETIRTATATVHIQPLVIKGIDERLYMWNGSGGDNAGSVFNGPEWSVGSLSPAGAETPDTYTPFDLTAYTSSYFYARDTVDNAGVRGEVRSNRYITIGRSHDVAIAFKAPRAGTIYVDSSSFILDGGTENTNGARFRVLKHSNGSYEKLYPTETDWGLIPHDYNRMSSVFGIVTTSVSAGDIIYFTANKFGSSAVTAIQWAPRVTYMSADVGANPNPLNLAADIGFSRVGDNISSEGGVQHNDTLQNALSLGKAEILRNNGTVTTTQNIANAVNFSDFGSGTLQINPNSNPIDLTVKFKNNYQGGRKLEDIDLIVRAQAQYSGKYWLDFSYSTTDTPTVFTHFYSVASELVPNANQSFTFNSSNNAAYPYIRLSGFNGQIENVDTIKITVNPVGIDLQIVELDITLENDEQDMEIAELKATKMQILSLPGVFGDNMVFQQNKPINVWGKGGKNNVVVTLANGGTVRTATVPVQNGAWSAELEGITGSLADVYTLTVEDEDDSSNSIALSNIKFGEVWLASGDSNMALKVSGSSTKDTDIAGATDGNIRIFSQHAQGAIAARDDVWNGQWSEAVNSAINEKSALAYHFAKNLYGELDVKVPIGIVTAALNSTSLQSWMCEEALVDYPEVNNFETANRYSIALPFETRAVAAFNGMIAPLRGVEFAGVVWYQGERNTINVSQYRELFPKFVECWRTEFDNPNLPFITAQLPLYSRNGTSAQPLGSKLPEFRETQMNTALLLDKVSFAVLVDTGATGVLVPTDKSEVGMRLAKLAVMDVYGESVAGKGPLFDYIEKDANNNIIIHFTHADGLKTPDSSEINTLEVSTNGTEFIAATGSDVSISGKTIVIANAENIQAVRYAYHSYVESRPNLYNGADLPAAPFRANVEPVPASLTCVDGTATVSVTLTDQLIDKKQLIIASYDEHGTLIDMNMQDVTAVLNDNIVYSCDVNTPDAAYYQAFYWDFDTVYPAVEKDSTK